MGLSDWASLALICLLGASSPGPSLIVILGNTRLYGRKAGLYASIGHGLGVWIYALLAATTLGLILTHYQILFTLIQGAGALLLVWIGGKLLHAILFRKTTLDTPAAPVANLRHSFRDGLAIAIWVTRICSGVITCLNSDVKKLAIFGVHRATARPTRKMWRTPATGAGEVACAIFCTRLA